MYAGTSFGLEKRPYLWIFYADDIHLETQVPPPDFYFISRCKRFNYYFKSFKMTRRKGALQARLGAKLVAPKLLKLRQKEKQKSVRFAIFKEAENDGLNIYIRAISC